MGEAHGLTMKPLSTPLNPVSVEMKASPR